MSERREIAGFRIEDRGASLCAILERAYPAIQLTECWLFGEIAVRFVPCWEFAMNRDSLLKRIHNLEAEGYDASMSRAALGALDVGVDPFALGGWQD